MKRDIAGSLLRVYESPSPLAPHTSTFHQLCARFTLKRACAFILPLLFFTTILTFSLLRHQTRDIGSSLDKNVANGRARKLRTNQSIEPPKSGSGRNRKIEVADDIRFSRKKTRGMYLAKSNEKSAKDRGELEMKEDSRRQAMAEVNLLKKELPKYRHTNETAPAKMLMSNVKLLRDAMVSHSTMLTQPSVTPSCVGDRKQGEVEDILCIPKPSYLKHVKSPCWYEKSLDTSRQPKLRCLPYFHILGCAKSGTTDLWMRLLSHPHMVANNGALHKEGLWWSWHRYGIGGYKRKKPVNFRTYVDIFRNVAQQIQLSLDEGNDNHTLLITGDGSPPDFWDFRGWPNITQNRGLEWPRVITPHLMKHFYDNPKFILMFRDPVDRQVKGIRIFSWSCLPFTASKEYQNIFMVLSPFYGFLKM